MSASSRSERPLVVATLNRAKGAELLRLLTGFPFVVTLLAEITGASLPEETGQSYRENALLKARAATRQTGMPALADDSGLEVDALGGAPGIFSARYGGRELDDRGRVEKLLEALKGVPDERRTARFRCVIALVDPTRTSAFPGGDETIAEGVVDGVITRAPRGTAGFGYDPVFFYPPLGRTFGELEPDEADQVSHRAGAVRALRTALGG